MNNNARGSFISGGVECDDIEKEAGDIVTRLPLRRRLLINPVSSKSRKSIILVLLLFVSSIAFISNAYHRPDSEQSATELGPSTESFPSSYSIQSVVDSDLDDDYWIWNETTHDWEKHKTTSTEVYLQHTSSMVQYGQFRFVLLIPRNTRIHSATLTVFETGDNGFADILVRRIDEVNVGPLENDVEKPLVTDANSATYNFDDVSDEWNSVDVTAMVQDQVELTGWQSGNYFGVEFHNPDPDGLWYALEDYQAAAENHAVLEVVYSMTASWLEDWQWRKSHVIHATSGAGVNHTVPIVVHSGSGMDNDNNVFLNSKSAPGFADIRFTDSEGTTLLDYWQLDVKPGVTTDYFTNISVDFVANNVNFPAAYYHHERTYVVFEGDPSSTTTDIDIYIMYYDHVHKAWSSAYYVAFNPLTPSHDTHGAPCMWIDSSGYIHVIYGAHNDNFRHAKSAYPEDITSWLVLDEIDVSQGTYPSIGYDPINDVVHMIYRGRPGPTSAERGIMYINSTDGGLTWSPEQQIVDLAYYSPDNWDNPYRQKCGLNPYNRELFHLAWTVRNQTFMPGDMRENIYYIYFNVSTGIAYNMTGYSLGTTVYDSEYKSHCLVWDSNDASIWGPELDIDANGYPYIMGTVQSHPYPNPGNEYTTFLIHWTGLDWQMQNITTGGTWGTGHDFIVYDSTNVTAFIPDSADNLDKWTWDGSSWSKNRIYTASDFTCYNTIPGPWSQEPNKDIQIIFCDPCSWDKGFHAQSYAWGAQGLVQKVSSEYSTFWVRIPGNLSQSDQVIYIYYGKTDAANLSQEFEVSYLPQPTHGIWGPEEKSNINAPSIIQEPSIANLEGIPRLYARAAGYNITMEASDPNGASDIKHLELSLISEDRTIEYWIVRYDSDTGAFSEQMDMYDFITLNSSMSSCINVGNTTNLIFNTAINWNHPNVAAAQVRCFVIDDDLNYDIRYYDMNLFVETRLDMPMGPTISDGTGAPDRGDINQEISVSGSITYLGDTLCPPESEIDVYIICTEVPTSPWRATNYEDSAGTFSKIVRADDEVGQDIYQLIVVPHGSGPSGVNLLYEGQSCTYIADDLAIGSPEEALNGLSYIADLFRSMASVLTIYKSAFDGILTFVLQSSEMLAQSWNSSFMMFAVITLLSGVLPAAWVKKHYIKRMFRRTEVDFGTLGFDLFTLLPTLSSGNGLQMVIDGTETSSIVLETDFKGVSERLRLALAVGKRPYRLLRLLSVDLENEKKHLSILGLVLDRNPDTLSL